MPNPVVPVVDPEVVPDGPVELLILVASVERAVEEAVVGAVVETVETPVLPVVDPKVVPDNPVEPLLDVPSVEGAVGASVVEASVVVGGLVGEQRRSPLQRLQPPGTVVDSVKPVVDSNVDPVEPIVVGKVVEDGLVENGSVEALATAVVLVGSDKIKERLLTFET